MPLTRRRRFILLLSVIGIGAILLAVYAEWQPRQRENQTYEACVDALAKADDTAATRSLNRAACESKPHGLGDGAVVR